MLGVALTKYPSKNGVAYVDRYISSNYDIDYISIVGNETIVKSIVATFISNGSIYLQDCPDYEYYYAYYRRNGMKYIIRQQKIDSGVLHSIVYCPERLEPKKMGNVGVLINPTLDDYFRLIEMKTTIPITKEWQDFLISLLNPLKMQYYGFESVYEVEIPHDEELSQSILEALSSGVIS